MPRNRSLNNFLRVYAHACILFQVLVLQGTIVLSVAFDELQFITSSRSGKYFEMLISGSTTNLS